MLRESGIWRIRLQAMEGERKECPHTKSSLLLSHIILSGRRVEKKGKTVTSITGCGTDVFGAKSSLSRTQIHCRAALFAYILSSDAASRSVLPFQCAMAFPWISFSLLFSRLLYVLPYSPYCSFLPLLICPCIMLYHLLLFNNLV